MAESIRSEIVSEIQQRSGARIVASFVRTNPSSTCWQGQRYHPLQCFMMRTTESLNTRKRTGNCSLIYCDAVRGVCNHIAGCNKKIETLKKSQYAPKTYFPSTVYILPNFFLFSINSIKLWIVVFYYKLKVLCGTSDNFRCQEIWDLIKNLQLTEIQISNGKINFPKHHYCHLINKM